MLSRQLSQLFIGIVGAVHVARFAWLVVAAPVGWSPRLVYLVIALAALVPGAGLVAHRPLGRFWWVSAFLIDALITLALVA